LVLALLLQRFAESVADVYLKAEVRLSVAARGWRAEWYTYLLGGSMETSVGRGTYSETCASVQKWKIRWKQPMGVWCRASRPQTGCA